MPAGCSCFKELPAKTRLTRCGVIAPSSLQQTTLLATVSLTWQGCDKTHNGCYTAILALRPNLPLQDH